MQSLHLNLSSSTPDEEADDCAKSSLREKSADDEGIDKEFPENKESSESKSPSADKSDVVDSDVSSEKSPIRDSDEDFYAAKCTYVSSKTDTELTFHSSNDLRPDKSTGNCGTDTSEITFNSSLQEGEYCPDRTPDSSTHVGIEENGPSQEVTEVNSGLSQSLLS